MGGMRSPTSRCSSGKSSPRLGSLWQRLKEFRALCESRASLICCKRGWALIVSGAGKVAQAAVNLRVIVELDPSDAEAHRQLSCVSEACAKPGRGSREEIYERLGKPDWASYLR
jgi:hypothetical protein